MAKKAKITRNSDLVELGVDEFANSKPVLKITKKKEAKGEEEVTK